MSYQEWCDHSRANAIAALLEYRDWQRQLYKRPGHRPRPVNWLRKAEYSRTPDDADEALKLSKIGAWSKI